jgi:peroxiredoxin
MDQRLVGLTFTTTAGVLQTKAPANGNLAPPGYYLLFILNKDGVPSVAQFVHLTYPVNPKVMKLKPTSSLAPSLKLPDGAGVIRGLADFRKRNVALVFFQGDCIHCADQLRNLVRHAREPSNKAIEILAVSSQKVVDPAAALRTLGVVESDRFQLLIDQDHHPFRDFDCYKSGPLHGLFLIDGEGFIRASYIGDSPFGETKEALQRLRDLSPRQ